MRQPTKKDLPLPAIHFDDDGVIRFWPNRILRDLVDAAREGQRLDLNTISYRFQNGHYSRAEVEQCWALLGYSISGYGELTSLISQRTIREADTAAEHLSKKLRKKSA